MTDWDDWQPQWTPEQIAMLRDVCGLPPGDEEPPEVVSVAEPGEGTGGDPIEEAVEDAQRNVFLIARSTRLGPKPKSSEMGKALEVPSPEVPGGLIHLSRLKCADPVRDRSSTIACHAAPRSESGTKGHTGHHILPDALKGILSNPLADLAGGRHRP